MIIYIGSRESRVLIRRFTSRRSIVSGQARQIGRPCFSSMASASKDVEQVSSNSTSNGGGSTETDTTSFRSGRALRYADVGINLTDPVFSGVYHERPIYDNDLDDVLRRATSVGCQKFMVTGSSLVESRKAVALARMKRMYQNVRRDDLQRMLIIDEAGLCYATVGVHPCSAKEFDESPDGAEKMLQDLEDLAIEAKKTGHATAFGEIGLDYDRLFLTGKEQQLRYFERQLEIAMRVQLPLFLHSRAASEDFENLLRPRLPQLPKLGLVHSFTGTVEEMQRLVAMGFHIGVNGCSLKTEENLTVVKEIPLDQLQIETDGPWCEMRASHASAKYLTDGPELPKAVKKEKFEKGLMVKGRNESVSIARVAHVVAKVKNLPIEEVCEAAWSNSIKMFQLGHTA